MKSGAVVAGKIVRSGDFYKVIGPYGQGHFPAELVKLRADDLEDAYQKLREVAKSHHSANARIALARWCLTHHLDNQARLELHEAAGSRTRQPGRQVAVARRRRFDQIETKGCDDWANRHSRSGRTTRLFSRRRNRHAGRTVARSGVAIHPPHSTAAGQYLRVGRLPQSRFADGVSTAKCKSRIECKSEHDRTQPGPGSRADRHQKAQVQLAADGPGTASRPQWPSCVRRATWRRKTCRTREMDCGSRSRRGAAHWARGPAQERRGAGNISRARRIAVGGRQPESAGGRSICQIPISRRGHEFSAPLAFTIGRSI